MPPPWGTTNRQMDQSPRFVYTTTVAASPAGGAETIVGTITITEDLPVATGVDLVAFAAFTVGTSGVSANLRIRQTNASGTVIAASGATTVTAANLKAITVAGLDTAATLPGQVYVVTLTVGSAAAASTVSAVYLRALVV